MLPTRQGSIRLFRFQGIEVFLSWWWFVAAVYELNSRPKEYSSFLWNVCEYLALFGIVLMHEFGHALACRQVGGKADQIVLWPLGGVAYVSPPQRPGAMLWSIAAGPLVNVVLVPVFTGLLLLVRASGLGAASNVGNFLYALWCMNLGLLVLNLLPIYPLDGGQILRSLLWFVLGRARSLMVTAIVGFCGLGVLILLAAFVVKNLMFWLICGFILLYCWKGLKQGRLLAKIAKLPRREGFVCPSCLQPPILGAYWRCGQCSKPFDTFLTQAVCPHCGAAYPVTHCLDCGTSHPIHQWVLAATGPTPSGP